jgi:hypothetical protein
MAKRTQKSLARTVLCATKFWSHCYTSGSSLDPIFNDPKRPCVATSRSGVRHVVRGLRTNERHKGRFEDRPSPREIAKAELFLVKHGFVEQGPSSLRVTEKGRRVKCATTNLSPWTDSEYPGAGLSGAGRSKKRKSSCGCGG